MAHASETIQVDGVEVRGIGLDSETRCAHYGTERDVIAIKFYCCETYYPCYECHDASVDHAASVWPSSEFDRRAVLCGVCAAELTIDEYLDSGMECPACGAAFNPGCRDHYHLYFDTSPA